MVIIKIWGGLGNQMFLYALYRSLLEDGKVAKMDTSYFSYFDSHNGYELPRIFPIVENYANNEECNKLANIKLDLMNRIIRKYIFQKKTHYVQDIYKDFGFKNEVLERDNVYFQGYFQSEKYFIRHERIIRNNFVFLNQLDEVNNRVASRIKASNSVSIHVRRGDYIQKGSMLGDVCTTEYYKDAIEYIKQNVPDPSFFVFSDDIEWCRNHLKMNECEYISHNIGDDSYKDMQLMSLCKHNIIANSSFSWWGAWLNGNPKKIVVANREWFHDNRIMIDDIVPQPWIKIG